MAYLDLLWTFLTVYRVGSVTRAAALLGLAQPTVTAQLQTLERRLQRPLFERSSRGVIPTEVAHQLAAQIAAPMDALNAVVAAEWEPADTLTRTVHLGGPAEFIAARVLPALADRVAAGLRPRVTLGLPDELITRLAEGRLDLVIATVRPRRAGIRATPLYDEEFVLVANHRWAERLGAPLSVEEAPAVLADVPLISYAEELPILRRYWRTVFGIRLSRPPALVVPDLRGVLTAVSAGAGISVLPRYLLPADETVRALVEPELPPINTLYLAVRAGAGPHPARDAVYAHLLAVARAW